MSLEDYIKISSIEDKFIKTNKITDEIFGEVFIYQNKNKDEFIISKNFFCKDKIQLEYILNQIKRKFNLKHQNLFNLIDYSVFVDNNIKITGYYNFPSKNLYHVIENNKEKKFKTLEDEVIKILNDCLNALLFLEENNLWHGDLRPEYIGFEDISNNYIITDRLNHNFKPKLQQYYYLKNNYDIYMSPILFNGILNRHRKINHNPFKSQIFSLGLIFLELLLSKDIQKIYNFENKLINMELLDIYFDEISKYYSTKIINIIKNMLTINEDERITAKEIKSQLVVNNTVNNNHSIYYTYNEYLLIKNKLKNSKILYRTIEGNIYTEKEYFEIKNN